MSLYVVPENQELLWNVISKNAYIQDFFAPYNPEKKNEWFKAIIRTFYEKYKLQKLTVADLNIVNKETIAYMIQNVREQINQPVAKTNTPTQTHPTYQPANSYTISTPPIIPDMRQDIYAKEFEQRQQEYVNLNKKVAPANVNFTEKADDGVIQNMDELVKQQMQQRAYEMSLIPPPISKINQPTTLPSPVNTAPPKLQIDAASNIEISIEELGSTSSKKSVTWKTDDPDMTRLDTEILVLRESINNMSKEFLQLKELFELTQTNIAQLKEANAELATKLNKSIEWSHISIVHLNEATTGLAMKYNELLTKQVEIPQIQSLLQPVLPIPSPDDIKSTMERILTQLDNE